jgi:hypothetical protein
VLVPAGGGICSCGAESEGCTTIPGATAECVQSIAQSEVASCSGAGICPTAGCAAAGAIGRTASADSVAGGTAGAGTELAPGGITIAGKGAGKGAGIGSREEGGKVPELGVSDSGIVCIG